MNAEVRYEALRAGIAAALPDPPETDADLIHAVERLRAENARLRKLVRDEQTDAADHLTLIRSEVDDVAVAAFRAGIVFERERANGGVR